MTRFQRFEDIEAWQTARQLANAVYDASEEGPFARDFGLRDQVRRAAVSVLSNIAEGFERESRAEFIRFLTIAKGSAGELRAQRYIAADRAYVAPELSGHLRDEAARVSKMLAGLIAYLRQASCRERTGREWRRPAGCAGWPVVTAVTCQPSLPPQPLPPQLADVLRLLRGDANVALHVP